MTTLDAHGAAVAVRLEPDELERLRRGAVVGPAPEGGRLRMEGPDARRFANGMFTQDLRDIQPESCTRSAFADDRGRMLGVMVVACTRPDTLDLFLEGVSGEAFTERYGRYIIFDDVELEDRSDHTTALRVVGGAAGDVLRAAGLPVPDPGRAVEHDGWTVLAAGREEGGFDLVGPVDRSPGMVEALVRAGAVHDLDGRLVEAARILAGRPRWPVDMRERAFVLEMGLQDALCSFDKGCFVGQEVINRMRTRGRVNRRLAGVTWSGPALPAGTDLLHGERKVGRLGTHVELGGRRWGLAVIDLPHDEPGTSLEAPGGVAIRTVTLPLADHL